MSDPRPDTEWAPMGRGSWRWLRGVQCWVTRHSILAGEPWSAEVDARHLSSVGPRARAEDLDTEADARAWCERWAEVIAREYDARDALVTARAEEREACARVCDEAATLTGSGLARGLADQIRARGGV